MIETFFADNVSYHRFVHSLLYLNRQFQRFFFPLQDPHLQYGLPPMSQAGMKRNAEGAGLDMMEAPESSDEDSTDQKPLIHGHLGDHDDYPPGIGRGKQSPANTPVPQGKKTKGRVKIKMEFIDNKLRRYTTFSKRKTGIMKKVSQFI